MEPVGSPIGFPRILIFGRVVHFSDPNLFWRPLTAVGPYEQMPVSKWLTGR